MLRQPIAASTDDVWAVISEPGYLAHCHPFCERNPVHRWPGIDSHDEIEYFNGRVVERRFSDWTDGVGYNIEVIDPGGGGASVEWRIAAGSSGAELTISLTPRLFESLPGPLRAGANAILARPMMRRYLRSVTQGVEWKVTTGQPVRRNQFGAHPWFSPRR